MEQVNKKSNIKKYGLIALGIISLVLGIIGIIIPLLPTTPFLLLSAWSFMRSSEKLHTWLLDHPWFGKYIRNFQEHKAIPLKTKIGAVGLLWFTIIFSIIYVIDSIYIQLLLLGIAIGVSAHILHYKTLKE